jgi:hypothetical protein
MNEVFSTEKDLDTEACNGNTEQNTNEIGKMILL